MTGGFAARLGLTALLAMYVILPGGCRRYSGPRMRKGMYFGSLGGIRFPEYDHMGKHRYGKPWGGRNGLVYTSRGGFLDLGHVREAADRTAYIAGIVHDNLEKGQTDFSFEVIEPARYFVRIGYPECWDRFGQARRKEIIGDISIRLGQYLAHTSLIWHEIVTWFGFTSTAVFSEHISSFSCEDSYSDLLGTRLAAMALRDTERSFDDAMTKVLYEELERLGAQPPDVARQALRHVRGKWYKGGGYFFARVTRRNFDTGADDGFITPWLVTPVDPNALPEPCPAPSLDFLADYGFTVELEMEPHEWQRHEVLALLGKHNPERIEPVTEFPVIVEHIRKLAKDRYGDDVDVSPYDTASAKNHH